MVPIQPGGQRIDGRGIPEALPRHRSRVPRGLISLRGTMAYKVFFCAVPENRHSSTIGQEFAGFHASRRPRERCANARGVRIMRLLASDLGCIRGGRQVFRDLSFAVGTGEALVVTGPNGVGKSSLLRLIAGLVRPTQGLIVLEGGDPELT